MIIEDANNKSIQDYPDLSSGDARRIVACINACQGISTELLEANPDGLLKRIERVERMVEIESTQLVSKGFKHCIAGHYWRSDHPRCPECELREVKQVNGCSE